MTPPTATPSPSRVQGLDTLRALAITLVFMYHYMVFVSQERTFGWASEVGWVGVDLFFVLSGYLIANQLFAGLARGEVLSLGAFGMRRALRTLPVYWLVLALYFLLPDLLGGRTPPPLWRFLTFTQNLGLQGGTAFSHAWSLCIEEQFYLTLPLLLLLGHRLGLGRSAGWALILGLVTFGILSRHALWQTYGREAGGQVAGYQTHVYYATRARFDEFLPGVAIALIKHFHRPLWERLIRRGHLVLALGTAATALMFWQVYHRTYIEGFGYGYFMSVWGYSLLALAFALLVVAALCPDSWLHRVRVPGAASLALWSYSIYLSHKGVAHVLARVLEPKGLPPGMLPGLIALVSVAGGALLYLTLERPFLRLRDRWVPSQFLAPHPHPGDEGEPASPREPASAGSGA